MRCEAVSVNVSHVDGSVVVDVDGELDALSAPILSGILHGIPPDAHVSIDMANVRFMDSSGLSVLAVQSARMMKAGGSLHIHNPSRAVLRVLEIASLELLLAANRLPPLV